MIIRPAEYLVNGMPTDKMIRSVVAEHTQNLTRLKRLRAYYDGDAPIMHRQRSSGLPNNRIAHPIARYIASITSGYLVGNPVGYTLPDENGTLDAILATFKRISISSIDAENARNAAIYGRGVEYLHMDTNAEIKICALNPENAFVVYDDTHESNPLFGVYYIPRHNEQGDVDGYNAWIMGESVIRRITATDAAFNSILEIEITPHYFGGVPMVEYWNGDDERGDFECVLPLIDAYDVLESDRINDKQQFVDAMLVLTGCTLDVDERGRTPGQQLREDKMLSLPDNQASAQYLTNTLHESDIDILRNAINEDIHKYAMVPDLSDKNFAANASGVAMRYKLLGLEYLTSVKEQWFREGLRTRLKLIANVLSVQGSAAIDVNDIEISMPRSMPANVLEMAQIASTLKTAGAASVETLVRTVHDDWANDAVETETEAIRRESDQFFNQRVELFNEKAISRTELRAQTLGETPEEAENAINAIEDSSADDGLNQLISSLSPTQPPQDGEE